VIHQDLQSHFLAAVIDIAAGGSPLSNKIARHLINYLFTPQAQPATDVLTKKEGRLLNLMAKGFRNQEAADILNISLHTVHSHLKNTYRKLNVSSKSEAVFEARQLRLI
jgi:DNA-binding CsgD family transcriptional regulator